MPALPCTAAGALQVERDRRVVGGPGAPVVQIPVGAATSCRAGCRSKVPHLWVETLVVEPQRSPFPRETDEQALTFLSLCQRARTRAENSFTQRERRSLWVRMLRVWLDACSVDFLNRWHRRLWRQLLAGRFRNGWLRGRWRNRWRRRIRTDEGFLATASLARAHWCG